jgi:uncharacterized protein (TIRG00374 family)
MNKYLRGSVIFLIALFALFTALLGLTNAQDALRDANHFFLALASIFFLLSVLIWLISWAYLIKKHSKASFLNLIKIGFASLYGALTPIQLGAEALRSISLKKYFRISYSNSISASMIAKGAKFFILALFAVMVFLLFLIDTKMEPLLFFGFLSGLFIVLLATLVFLLPLKKGFGKRVSSALKIFSKKLPLLSKLGDFFFSYSAYIGKTEKKSLLIVFVLAFFSWMLEFFALLFCFISLNVFPPLHSLLIFLVIVAILERTPFLPRGIGLVELVGYHFLAFPELFGGQILSINQIGAVLIIYAVVRLVIPTILSIAISVLALNFDKNPEPEQAVR